MEENPPSPSPSQSFESFPLTRPEYISAMVHFYRGEMYRSQIWRTRLDNTTNWAVVTVGGMISFAFASPEHSPVTVLLSGFLITIFLVIEARRYRYFAVFRARVRMIEENFYLPLIRRNLMSPKGDWRERVAEDLDRPKFKTTYLEALLFRLSRNFIYLYAIILGTWVAKLIVHPTPAFTLAEIYGRMGIGPIAPWAILALVLLFYAGMIFGLVSRRAGRAAVDEIHGLERDLEHWKV